MVRNEGGPENVEGDAGRSIGFLRVSASERIWLMISLTTVSTSPCPEPSMGYSSWAMLPSSPPEATCGLRSSRIFQKTRRLVKDGQSLALDTRTMFDMSRPQERSSSCPQMVSDTCSNGQLLFFSNTASLADDILSATIVYLVAISVERRYVGATLMGYQILTLSSVPSRRQGARTHHLSTKMREASPTMWSPLHWSMPRGMW